VTAELRERSDPGWDESMARLVPEITVASPLGTVPRDVVEGIRTPPLQATTNILLAGLDTRPDQYGGRTDALVVLVLDDRSAHVGLVGIPRDLLVAIPGHAPNRINAVYNTGLRQGGETGGTALLQQVVRHSLGLPLQHVVFIDHAGFEALIDTMGGITVGVRCPIRDRFRDQRGTDGRLELALEAGAQRLDGTTALMYARSRHGRSIFDRAVRQQAVLIGVRDRLVELGPAQLAGLLPALRKTVYTDLSLLELVRLSRRVTKIRREHIHGLVLGPRHGEIATLEDGRWVMLPRSDAISEALSHLFEAGAPGERSGAGCPDADVALRPSGRDGGHRGSKASFGR
jgi:LCP family protein required for cell wall assembly